MFPDVYLPADAPDGLVTRSHAAYLLVRDAGGMLAGYSASALLDADRALPWAPAEVLVPGDTRARPGPRVCRGRVTGMDVVAVDGVRVTAPLRTGWDLARRLPLVEAVVAVDSLERFPAGRAARPAGP